MALGEREEVREHLEEADESEGLYLDEKRTQVLHFFFLLGGIYFHRDISYQCSTDAYNETFHPG